MVVNASTGPFLKRMLGQRSGMLVCALPAELGGKQLLGILADHSIRLNMGHVFQMDGATYDGATLDGCIDPGIANALTRAYMRSKPDYRLFERPIDKSVLMEMIHTVMNDGNLAIGHLHSDSSFIALDKLRKISSSSTALASILNGIFAINYINLLCPYCKTEVPPAHFPGDLILTGELDGALLTQYRGAGCEHCGETGYAECDVLTECLEITPEIRDALLRSEVRNSLKRLGKINGTATFLDSAWVFFRSGLTTLDEVRRIAAATK